MQQEQEQPLLSSANVRMDGWMETDQVVAAAAASNSTFPPGISPQLVWCVWVEVDPRQKQQRQARATASVCSIPMYLSPLFSHNNTIYVGACSCVGSVHKSRRLVKMKKAKEEEEKTKREK